MRFGLDYVSPPTVGDLKAAKATFVARYISTPGNPKNLTVEEARELHAAGLDIVLVFETVANETLGGAFTGARDARSADEQLRALGAPAGQPVYFAVDFDAQPDQEPQLEAYFRAAGGVLGPERVGCYGGYYVVKRLFDAKLIAYGWQTLAWSGGRWDPRARLRQTGVSKTVGGHGVDFDDADSDDFGQWRAHPPAPKPKPAPKPNPKPEPKPSPDVVITGPHGHLIAHRTLAQARALLAALLRRFGRVTIRKA